MAQIKFEKNGQGFYDFDALLEKTNEQFVEIVQDYVTSFDKYIRSIVILDVDQYVKVFIQDTITMIYVFWKHNSNITQFTLTSEDLKIMGDMQ